MIIKNSATDQSLDILLKGAKSLNALKTMEAHAASGAFSKFKSVLAGHICYLGAVVNASLVSPKATALDLEGALRYLLLFVCRAPELFGRIHYYFEDAEYVSVQTGTNLYNLMVECLGKALQFDGFSSVLLRINPVAYDLEGAPKDKKSLSNCDILMEVLPRAVHDPKKKIYEVKVAFDITNIEDPEAWFGFILVDVAAKTKSHVIGVRNKGGDRIQKTYTMEVPESSISDHNRVEIVGIVQARLRLPKLDKNGTTKIPTYTGEVQLSVNSYLTTIVEKK